MSEPRSGDSASDVYHTRAERFAAAASAVERRSRLLSHARIVVFAAAVGAFVLAELASYRPLPVVGGSALLVLFIALVVHHERVRERLRRFEALRDVNVHAGHRLRRDWSKLPATDASVDASHPYAHDLDIVGHASLYRLIGYNATPFGKAMLLDWLLAPAAPEEVTARQDAVAELAPELELRDDLAARARLMGRARPSMVERFAAWAEAAPWLRRDRRLLAIVRITPIVTIGLLALKIAGVIPLHLWLIPLAVHFWAMFRYDARIRESFARAAAGPAVFTHLAGIMDAIAQAELHAPRLVRAREELRGSAELRRLARLMHLADLRSSMFHFPIQALTLYDFHVLAAIEAWKAKSGARIREWVGAVGEVEALAALASLSFDHPEWSRPLISAETPRLTGESLGHPLLREDARVDNDVEIGPPGSFLLVTGSNMSGKSTLLRAIGTNVVLAQAGGPVCARSLRLAPSALLTCMRVTDSLEEGVSYFMAELKRLKGVVDAADTLRGGDRIALYLLDEILGGTNTAERQVAVRRVIRHLLDVGAIGAVTTHDLALAELPELTAASRPVHFQESLGSAEGDGMMSFDYRLRPGVATSVNALRLMEMIGLRLV